MRTIDRATHPSPPTYPERRRRRADLITQALQYQLLACCEDGHMDAMVLADQDGLPLAASGDRRATDELAATMVHVGARASAFRGTLLRGGQPLHVEMTKLLVDGSPLLLCAVGGTPEQRAQQVARGAQGALRILGA